MGLSDGVGVRQMLDAMVRDGALQKHENVREASGKAQVRPKSSEKCAFKLNCLKQNTCDEILFCWGQRLYMAKSDLSNWFCGVCACLGRGSGSSVCAWAMPNMFGSPCHLARNTRPSCVRSWCIAWSERRCGGCLYCFFVYPDDILIVGTRRFVRKAVRRQRLQRVGFVISQKSVTEPAHDLDFVCF